MSLGIAIAAGATLAAAVIGSVGLLRSDRRKRKEARRIKGIESYRQARTSWDQAQIVEVEAAVRRQKLQEARADLMSLQLLVGSDLLTTEFEQLLGLLDGDPLADGGVNLATAQNLWPVVEVQIHKKLST